MYILLYLVPSWIKWLVLFVSFALNPWGGSSTPPLQFKPLNIINIFVFPQKKPETRGFSFKVTFCGDVKELVQIQWIYRIYLYGIYIYRIYSYGIYIYVLYLSTVLCYVLNGVMVAIFLATWPRMADAPRLNQLL